MTCADALHGVLTPILTPFSAQGAIDHQALRRLVDFLIQRGIHGIMVGGTVGEGMLLSLEERRAALETVVDTAAGRIPVVAHVGCISTADTVALAQHAVACGTDAVSAVAPYFFPLDDESLYAHYCTVAQAIPHEPVFLYTIPDNARNDISPSLLRMLRQANPNIVGIKVSNPNLLRFQEYQEVGGEDFAVFCGTDGLMLPALALGAKGQVAGNSNVFPEPFCKLYQAFQCGNLAEARRQQRQINVIRLALGDGLHPAAFKAVLPLRGLPAAYVRPPMRELTAAEELKLKADIARLGLLSLDPIASDTASGGDGVPLG